MLSRSSTFGFALLVSVGFVATAPAPDMYIPPVPHATPSTWTPIRTDEAAWQDSCGHTRRVGAVCLSAEHGDRTLYGVQSTAQQDVVFSGGGHYFHAYCPNLDKGEKPYSLEYGLGDTNVYYHVLGRTANQRCCNTQYTNPSGKPDPIQCIEPAVGSGALFPPEEIIL